MDSYEGSVVEVEWLDAQWLHEDSTPDEWSDEDFIIHTFGYCARDTAKSLVVSHEYNHQGVHRGVTTIPKPFIKIVRIYGYANTGNGSSDS